MTASLNTFICNSITPARRFPRVFQVFFSAPLLDRLPVESEEQVGLWPGRELAMETYLFSFSLCLLFPLCSSSLGFYCLGTFETPPTTILRLLPLPLLQDSLQLYT